MSKEPGDAIEFHENLSAVWIQKYNKASFNKRMKSFSSLLDANELNGQLWLDAGCGTGIMSRALASRGCTVIGVDASPGMIREAMNSKHDQNCASANEPVFEVVQTIERLDFEESAFDGIVCSSVLEYLGDPNAALEQFNRTLRSGGLLLVSVPNKVSILRNIQKTSFVVLRKCFGMSWPQYLAFSKNSYTCKSFSRLLGDSGFTVLSSTRHCPYMPKFLSSMQTSASIFIFLARKD